MNALIEMQIIRGQEQFAASELRRIGQHAQSLAAIHDLLTREASAHADAQHIQVKSATEKLMVFTGMAIHRAR